MHLKDTLNMLPCPETIKRCTPTGCLLCSGATAVTGIWITGGRMILYGLCDGCSSPSNGERVEKEITAMLRVN